MPSESAGRHHAHGAELVEMSVERECLLDAKSLHDDTAGAVGEAPSLVAERAIGIPAARTSSSVME
jgi:hypothetical protein